MKWINAISSWSWRTNLNLGMNIAVLVAFFVLDLRDLYYKTQWIGPYDTYEFIATSIDPIRDKPVALTTARENATSAAASPFASGWGSFLEPCDNLTAIGSTPFLLQVIGTNCRFGDARGSSSSPLYTAKSVYFTANQRVDAVAWACCELVLGDRQPPICQSDLVLNFLARANMEPPAEMPSAWMALPDSPAENELLAMLQLISRSPTLNRVVCTAGFIFDFENSPVGIFNLTTFGCGSADQHKAVFVGHFASSLHQLLDDKMWVTVDDLNLVGFHFNIRQNCRAHVEITQLLANDRSSLQLLHASEVNFSSSGSLYLTLLVIDVILMVVNLISSCELAFVLIYPLISIQKISQEEKDLFTNEDYLNFFSRSLYRSKPIMLLALVSQLLSWMVILPNAIIWTWNSSFNCKFQALLSTLRLWVLLLITLNTLWDIFVFGFERLAYNIVRRTYITTIELNLIGILTCYWERGLLFAIGGAKYALEDQRLMDFESFLNPDDDYSSTMLAYGISFNPHLDYLISTPTRVLWTIYWPLFHVLSESVGFLGCFALMRMGYFAMHRRLVQQTSPPRGTHGRVTNGNEIATTTPIKGNRRTSRMGGQPNELVHPLQANLVPPSQHSTAHSLRQSFQQSFRSVFHVRPSLQQSFMEVSAGFRWRHSVRINSSAQPATKEYARLPLEVLLDTPIRARSLVRTGLEMEIVTGHFAYLRPPLYFDFGIFVRNGFVRTRSGFFNAFEPQIRLSSHTEAENAARYVSAHVPLR